MGVACGRLGGNGHAARLHRFTKGLKLEADTRIQADERRTETFSFPVPASATAHVTLKLHYEHAPTGGAENRTWLTFYSENRTLPPGER